MAPFNLEKNIREKLENRELSPSADAWKKLESQLGNTRPKKNVSGWYYLAASVVGLLIAVSVFLNRNTVEVENQFVIENPRPTDAIPNKLTLGTESGNPLQDENLPEKSETGKEPKREDKTIKPSPKESAIDIKIKKSAMLANTEENLKAHGKHTEIPIIKDDPIFNSKIDEVVASVKLLQQRNEDITVEEVETLLENARREIQTKKILRNQKVDATALLEDVEWELERDFRDKIFDVLGEGFNKLRTAISQRND